MSDKVLKVDDLSKIYRLGEIGTGTLSHDLNRWWASIRGKDDPYSYVGQVNGKSKKSTSNYVYALKNVSLELNKGEVLGIIGKNGAGKSTLLKIISRITAPTKGYIKANGTIASLLEVGTGMHPEMTARENVYLNGAILGMRKFDIDRKFDSIIDFAGCNMFVDTPVKRFSSGMRVRLGFAVAAFLEPDILVVDEVLAVGDAEFQKKAVGKIQDISNERGRTILFVSHNMHSVQNLCSRVCILDKGMLTYNGSVNQGIEKYIVDSSLNMANNLIERKDRVGSGRLLFDNWELIKDGNKVNLAITGSPLSIKFKISSHSKFSGISFSIGFFNASEGFLTACKSDAIQKVFDIEKGENTLEFSFDKLPLSSGRYIFNLAAYNGSEILDWIKGAGSFDVENGDFYGSGILPAIGKQGVFVKYDWAKA